MNKEAVELQLELLNDKLEMVKDRRKFGKRTNRFLIGMGTLTILSVVIISTTRGRVSIIDVFSMSLLVNCLYRTITEEIYSNSEDEHEVKKIEMEIKFIEEVLLKEMDMAWG